MFRGKLENTSTVKWAYIKYENAKVASDNFKRLKSGNYHHIEMSLKDDCIKIMNSSFKYINFDNCKFKEGDEVLTVYSEL